MWHICCFSPRSEQPRRLFQSPKPRNLTPEDKNDIWFWKITRVITHQFSLTRYLAANLDELTASPYTRWRIVIMMQFLYLIVFIYLTVFVHQQCFWVEQAFFFPLPAYVGSRVFVPKDSRTAKLCVLVVLLDSLLYIMYSVSALKWPR